MKKWIVQILLALSLIFYKSTWFWRLFNHLAKPYLPASREFLLERKLFISSGSRGTLSTFYWATSFRICLTSSCLISYPRLQIKFL